MSKSVRTIPINNWKQLVKVEEDLHEESRDGWIFRGQSNVCWDLASTLERAIPRFGRDMKKAFDIEGGLIRRFQRQAQQYISYLPPDSNYLEWLAWMQHYGAPTRLLDWTHSFYVAVFFALDGADCNIDTAVWALNWKQLHKELSPEIRTLVDDKDRNLQEPESFKRVLGGHSKFVIKLNPFRFNDRLIIQQGTFLIPSDVRLSFRENLDESLRNPPRTLVKIHISGNITEQANILRHLFRMNLTRATLFPGLEGFSRSLSTMLAIPEILVPPENWSR